MSKDEKLAILNSIPVVESEGDGYVLLYAYIEDTEENREKLAQVVPNVEGFMAQYRAEEIEEGETPLVDVQMAAWDYTDANYFDGKQFILDKELPHGL